MFLRYWQVSDLSDPFGMRDYMLVGVFGSGFSTQNMSRCFCLLLVTDSNSGRDLLTMYNTSFEIVFGYL